MHVCSSKCSPGKLDPVLILTRIANSLWIPSWAFRKLSKLKTSPRLTNLTALFVIQIFRQRLVPMDHGPNRTMVPLKITRFIPAEGWQPWSCCAQPSSLDGTSRPRPCTLPDLSGQRGIRFESSTKFYVQTMTSQQIKEMCWCMKAAISRNSFDHRRESAHRHKTSPRTRTSFRDANWCGVDDLQFHADRQQTYSF